jgi:hypothetical protein
MYTITDKGHAHELLDRVEPAKTPEVVRFLESLAQAPVAEAPKKRHRQEESEWLSSHQEELKAYRGQWVVVEPTGIVAADADHDTVWRRAKELGIESPLMFRVWENDLPFAGY